MVARANAQQVLVLDPLQHGPREMAAREFEAGWSGHIVLLTRRTSCASQDQRFGFPWFYREILKYRRLLAEVIVTSLFIQLLGLITPLFFQVIIDKVLVHRSLTTLDVLATGLLAVSLFEVILSALRTYLFSHTTNRIDVSLGAELFSHLLALPLSYFEARRVGDTVARVRELESVRSFLTGSGLTVAVDLGFTVVFLVVMYLYSQVLTLVVLATLPCYASLSLAITPVLRNRLSEKFNRGAENHSFLVETVHGIQTIKSSATEPYGQKRWEERLAGYVNASFRATNLSNIANQLAALINKVTVVLILWIGARLVMEGELGYRSAGGIQHAGEPGKRTGAAYVPAVARLPTSRYFHRPTGGYSKYASRASPQSRTLDTLGAPRSCHARRGDLSISPQHSPGAA